MKEMGAHYFPCINEMSVIIMHLPGEIASDEYFA